MIQLIDKQAKIFRVKNTEFQFVKPYYLLIGWEFRKATVTGSTMIWNIKNEKISYNQLKQLLNPQP